MADKIKRAVAFILAASVSCFIAWVGGIEFNERSPELAFALMCAVWVGLMAAVLPFMGNRR